MRGLILQSDFPQPLVTAVREVYQEMSRQAGRDWRDVAVRSSATAEDLAEVSFAGQLERFLNVRGEEALLAACKRCVASLFTDRAISYREEHGFDHMKVAVSVGVQAMVRCDEGGSGVMFSIDTETGFPQSVLINAAWGLGDTIVQGTVDPDEYHVFKPLLNEGAARPIVEKRLDAKAHKMVDGGADEPAKRVETSEPERARFVLGDDEVLRLARWACAIEEHHQQPMDMEWAKNGETGELYIMKKAAPSDHRAFAQFLVRHGIESVSVTPDSFLAVKRHVAEAEAAGPGPRDNVGEAKAG